MAALKYIIRDAHLVLAFEFMCCLNLISLSEIKRLLLHHRENCFYRKYRSSQFSHYDPPNKSNQTFSWISKLFVCIQIVPLCNRKTLSYDCEILSENYQRRWEIVGAKRFELNFYDIRASEARKLLVSSPLASARSNWSFWVWTWMNLEFFWLLQFSNVKIKNYLSFVKLIVKMIVRRVKAEDHNIR